jgi:beta-phosphoglucomutase-like phosphatase (HAD superfamily)
VTEVGPGIFLEAVRRLGLEPASCLVIEDAVSGFAAAKAAGSRCLGLTTSFSAKQLSEAGVDQIAEDLQQSPEQVLDW